MNLKLLIAACCLFAAVQARPPRPLSSSCSVSCLSRTFWSGYQAGNVYTYDFDQSVELSSDLNPSQASRLRINGQAKVEVHSECEMALTVEVKNAQVGDVGDASELSPRDPPAKVLAGLRAPLRFAFDNGRIVELCPGSEETRASLNLKRGLLSQLQVSTEQRGQEKELEERDILGDCWTEYTPDGPNTLIKTKDLSKCKLNYQAYPLLGVKSFEDEVIQSKRPITKGSVTCRIEVDPERDIVKSTSCHEEQRQSMRHQADSVEEKIRTVTSLTLKRQESGLVTALHEVSKRTDLRHGHKTAEQCQKASAWLDEDFFNSANECLERTHGAQTSTEYKAKANQTLEELCQITKNQAMSRDVPRKYSDLIKYMRGITEQRHLAELYQQVRSGRYCSENPLMLVIMRSAIPTVGTKQSVAFIIDELSKSEDGADGRNDWLVNGIALMQHPTPEILPELLKYVRDLRNQDQAIITGVNRDEPLALSAVVHKICQELPNCESDSRVKAVIDYFAESMGPACDKLSGAESDNAFVALLAIGNMGRMNGGASPLIQCAKNQRLPTVYRAFALHSLRRFANFSTGAQGQLIELMLDDGQDAELRIAAYQSLARHGFSNWPLLRDAVIRLLNDKDADRQVQMFVYSHLQNLQGQDARQMSPVLRSAKIAGELKKLSRSQYSNVLRGQYYSPALEAGAQAEVPIVFSAQSAIPRYIGLNLTVNLPGQGQSINLMEVGVRMQGLEKLIEQTYSLITKKFGSTRESSVEPSSTSELSEEQRILDRTPNEPRIDLFFRKYGVEFSHTDLSGGILASLPSLIASRQVSSSIPAANKAGASAGTLLETTLSIPTTAGLPILVKQEAHYITNVRTEMSISERAGFQAELELQPTAAVQMLRTVAVDAVFERAGIQSSTSFVTSTGLRLSLKNSLAETSDRQLLVKIEPLKKKQSLADVKTEVKFFQHNAGKVHTEKPLTPQQASVQSEKCIEGLAKKLGGHKICYKTESLPNCQTSPCKIFQCPSSYELYLEKGDDFGAFEAGFKWKNERDEKQLQLLIGDRKSKERLLKLNIQSIKLSDKTNYKFELQNPIFPIIIDSNFTQSGAGKEVNTEAQIGSVKYVATGSVRPDSEKGLVIEGEFYPKDRTEQKVKVSLEHKLTGFTPVLLPIATTKLGVKMHTENELSLEYDLKLVESNFFWQMSSQYKTQKGDKTSMRYRVQYRDSAEARADTSTIFLYDFALENPLGKNLMHSLHSKLIRRLEADGTQYSATISHKLQYGSEMTKSPVDFDVRFGMKAVESSQKTEISGDGNLVYVREGRSVTAKVEKVKIEIGQFTNATDGFGKQYKYSVSYGIKFDDQSANYQAELQHLPWSKWTLAKQAVQLKIKAQLGSKSYSVNLKHALNGEKWQSEQVAKLEYNDYIYFHLDSKLKKHEGIDAIRHELFLQDSQENKLQIKSGLARPEEGVLNADVIVEKNTVKVLGCRHSLRLKQVGQEQDHELKHSMTVETQSETYSMDNSAKIDQQSLLNMAEFMTYQVRLVTGKFKIGKSLQLLANLLWDMKFEHKSQLTGPTASQQALVENVIKLRTDAGVIWKHQVQISQESVSPMKYGMTVSRKSDARQTKIKIEVNYNYQNVKTEATMNMENWMQQNTGSLKIESMDSWGWHNVNMNVASGVEYTTERTQKREALLKLEGQINRMRLDSNLNITIASTDADYWIVTLNIPETMLRLQLKSSAKQKAAELKMDGDFGILPFKSMKTDFNMVSGLQVESMIEIDGTKLFDAKLKVENGVIMADLKTGHPLLQEAGFKIGMNSNVAGTVEYNVIIKLVSLSKRMQIKNTGTVTIDRNSPSYSFMFGLTGIAEFEGLERLTSNKKFEHELMVIKKPGMEFQIVYSASCPDRTASKEHMLFFTSNLNYWPFKAEVKVKAKDYSGWEVKYGARAEVDNKNAFAGIEYNDKEVAASFDFHDLPYGTKMTNFRVKCSFCSNENRDIIVVQANMTYPMQSAQFQLGLDMDMTFSRLQKVTFRIEQKPTKKQILAAFRWNGNTQKLIDWAYTQNETPGGFKGDVLLQSDLRFFLGETARAELRAGYKKLDQSSKCEWQSSFKLANMLEPITANWEQEDGRLKSGKVNAFGRESALVTTPTGDIQVTLTTDSSKPLRLKWSGKYESMQDFRAKIEIEVDGEASIAEVKVQSKQAVINYGKLSGPNSLRIKLHELSDASADLTVNHETNAEKNTELTLWPGYNIQVPTTRYPMKLTISVRSALRILNIAFEAPSLGVKTMYYRHDLTNFPKSFETQSKIVSASDEMIWEMKIDVDMDLRRIETECKIGNKFKISFKEPKFQLKFEDVMDLEVQIPRILSGSEDSDKKEILLQLSMPIVAIVQPVRVKISMQQLTEGHQWKIKYGLGDDTDQISWQLTARKYSLKPTFDIDIETSLASKFDLLWQIRSIEARLESSMVGSDDAYTIVFKDSIKTNGEDLFKAEARIDGEKGTPLKMIDVTVTGKMESKLKFELARDDEPLKLSFSLDKFGDSRQKYSMKLTYSPAKQNALLPDFKLDTECPHRQFFIGKEFKETAGKSLVTLEFYLDKRQSHGATIIYKAESLESERPKYTLEVALPTRKIRTICQPEVSDKKSNVKTTIAWDADQSSEKVIELNTRLDTRSDIEAELELKAPFLRNPVKLQARVEYKETGYTAQLKHKNGESEVLKVKAEYGYEERDQVDRWSFEVSGADDNKVSFSARGRKEADNYDWYKIDGDINWKIGSLEKNIKFVYRPMREITVSCDHGASLSLMCKTDKKNLIQLVAFVSSNDKNSARLKLTLSAPTKKITMKLDTGRGSFNHNTDLSLPNYRPDKVLMRAKISAQNQDLSATIFLGEMTVGQKPDLLDATSVPSHLVFFGLVYRQVDRSFRVNWRSPSQERTDSAISSIKRSLYNNWSAALPTIREAKESLAPFFGSASANLDSAWIAEELRNLASNDFDQLNLYVLRILASDEFYLGSILGACEDAARYARAYMATVAQTLAELKEGLDLLPIWQKISEWRQLFMEAVVSLYNKIPVQDVIDSLVEYVDQLKSLANYWNANAMEAIDTYMRIVQRWLEKAQECLDRLAPVSDAAKNIASKMWAKARTMLIAMVAGAKPLAVDDILPLVMNHIVDIQVFRSLYNNLMLELRVWYDTGATPAERDAFTQTNQFLSYIFSEESLSTWRYLLETAQLILNGEIREGISRLGSQIRYTVWRPVCDDACQRGEAPFAAIEGAIEGQMAYKYMTRWPSGRAIKIVLKRIANSQRSLQRSLLSAVVKMTLGDWNPASSLLAIHHRTAILSGDNSLITFDGVTLSHKRPCSYLVARDFESGIFSIVQEYNKHLTDPERLVRGSLKIRFGKIKISVERNGTVKVNGKAESLPLVKQSDDKSVDAKREGDMTTVQFHGKVPNTLVVRCSRSADSCLVSVHPLYNGRVLGLAGSNDGRRANDIREGRASTHINFWTAGQCEADAAIKSETRITDEETDTDSRDCNNWFSRNASPLSDCFETIDAQPYKSLCRRQERQDRDACDVARQYVTRCNIEGISVRVPAKCTGN